MEDQIDQLASDLQGAITDVINNFRQGHAITLATAVGVLEVIKFNLIAEVLDE